MQEPGIPNTKNNEPAESIKRRFGGVNLTYVPLDADSFRDEQTAKANELIAREMANNDVIIMEYFPPEIGEDPIFAVQQVRFPKIAALARGAQKPVLTIDPAFDSQFLIDFRGIPLGAGATIGGIATALIGRELGKDSKEPKSRRGVSRRKILYGLTGVAGVIVAAPGASAVFGEMQLKSQPDTAFPAEGTVRRIIVARGIQNAGYYLTGDFNKEVNALVVYPDWLRLSLTKYMDSPEKLEEDFRSLSRMKQIPRLKHYFQARLWVPEIGVDGRTTWKKSVREIT